MPWAKVDDRLHSHPKASAAGLDGLGLHLLAMSWVAAYQTDGHVPVDFVQQRGSIPLAERLTTAGLWDQNGDGWVIHDWLDYNPSRRQTERVAKAKQKAGRVGGRAASKR